MAALKRDYYDVLGISRDADGETIRRAFHDLARKWHPDVADAPDAEARFRELAEAYSVLATREARLLYDRYGYRGRGNQGFDEALWEARPTEVIRGDNIHTDLAVRSFEADAGTRRVIGFQAIVRCARCMGRGSLGPDAGAGCPACEGRGTVETQRRIKVRIPAGVDDGALLRISGDGHDAGAGSVPGDLFVRVHVLPAAKDPQSVRYVALVLLLVAIALLAVYVIR